MPEGLWGVARRSVVEKDPDDAMASLDYQPGQPLPGTVYKILRLIGVGGMGTVYDVEDTTIGKRYVIKTLHPKLGAREDLARRMLKEARTLARLNHPNIVEVITAGVTADDLKLPYYVMERLERAVAPRACSTRRGGSSSATRTTSASICSTRSITRTTRASSTATSSRTTSSSTARRRG